MASNTWTQGSPLAANSTKVVLAQRVFIAAADQAYTDPTAKLNGTGPTGSPAWVDLGIVAGSKVTLSYNKETKYVETGLEKVRRGAYITGKNANLVFSLEQFDTDVLEAISGLTATALAGSPSVGNKMYIGQEAVVEKALLILGTNVIDAKEHQMYCKKAQLVFNIEEQDDARVLKVTAELSAFSPGSGADCFFTYYILD